MKITLWGKKKEQQQQVDKLKAETEELKKELQAVKDKEQLLKQTVEKEKADQELVAKRDDTIAKLEKQLNDKQPEIVRIARETRLIIQEMAHIDTENDKERFWDTFLSKCEADGIQMDFAKASALLKKVSSTHPDISRKFMELTGDKYMQQALPAAPTKIEAIDVKTRKKRGKKK